MEERERIRQVRLALHLTGAQMGAGIGLGRSMLSKIELGDSGITDRTRSQICSVYNVNEHWLRTGEGEMFDKTPARVRYEALTKYGFTERAATFLNTFAEQDEAVQEAVITFLIEAVERVKAAHPDYVEEKRRRGPMAMPETDADIHAELQRQLDEQKEARGRSSQPSTPEESAS